MVETTVREDYRLRGEGMGDGEVHLGLAGMESEE